ncbi:MAG TPA: diacylglycerol kinase family protein [Puia sp.]|nr:diacylglycerol kinase family protein [Puia sp.]
MRKEKFSISRQLKSVIPAISGIRELIITQHNARIHLTATIAVIAASFLFKTNTHEVVALSFAIGLVWVAEMFNTCIEKTLDFISTERDPEIKSIKDIAAGAVLIASLTALIVGLFIFIPKIF